MGEGGNVKDRLSCSRTEVQTETSNKYSTKLAPKVTGRRVQPPPHSWRVPPCVWWPQWSYWFRTYSALTGSQIVTIIIIYRKENDFYNNIIIALIIYSLLQKKTVGTPCKMSTWWDHIRTLHATQTKHGEILTTTTWQPEKSGRRDNDLDMRHLLLLFSNFSLLTNSCLPCFSRIWISPSVRFWNTYLHLRIAYFTGTLLYRASSGFCKPNNTQFV